MAEPTSSELIPPPVELCGIPIHPVSGGQLVNTLISWGDGADQRHVYNVNVHAMNLAARDGDFRSCVASADLVFCDGFGVKWGARIAGGDIPHRLTPMDWIDSFAAGIAAAGQSLFAVGDEPGVAARFQQMLSERHTGYANAGSHHGFFDRHGPENDAVIADINRSGATHLLVGMGMPMQEFWIQRNAARLRPKVLIPVGGLFRVYTGTEPRPPRWMSDHGLEWLGRLVRHPIRLFGRYAIGNPAFILRVLRWRLLPPSRRSR